MSTPNQTQTNQTNQTKPLKAVGKERKCPDGPDWGHAQNNSLWKLDQQAKDDEILDDETIKSIKEVAVNSPATKEMIEQAKKFTFEYKDEIYKQCTDLVALYNIAHKKPFFFITPAEARLAIDYIKKCRDGHVADLEKTEERDAKIYVFMDSLEKLNINTNIENMINVNDVKLTEEIQRDIDKICGLEMGEELSGTLTSQKWKFLSKSYNVVEAMRQTTRELDKTPFSEEMNEKLNRKEPEDLPEYFVYNAVQPWNKPYALTLSFINQMFAIMERQDLTVDVMLMNAFRVADIRAFGQSVYDEYNKKELMRRRVFGRLFTAEIYPCNKLEDNQIIFGSVDTFPGHGIFLNVVMHDIDKD